MFANSTTVGTAARPRRSADGARANLRHHVLDIQETFNVLDRARMPVLAAIQGGCVGGGVDLTSACDCRYATEDAFFVVQEINIGMTADVGTFPRLCKLLPQGMVRELAYSGRRLPAKKALEFGLVNEIFPTQDAMMKHVMALAKEIAGEIAARRARLEGDDQLCARSFHRRRPRLHRDLAGRHVQSRKSTCARR